METISCKPSSYDEYSMKQSFLFEDSLKELKNLRTQLYSAAEYFELSYVYDDQKQLVVDTLKDYAIKAFVSTVDHLGSVAYKVNGILDESVSKASNKELQISNMEQRLQTSRKFIESQGVLQQSMVATSPKFHKRYILPAGETMSASGPIALKHQLCSLDDEDEWHQFKTAVQSSIRETPSSLIRKGRSPSPSPRPSPRLGPTFSFTEKPATPDKRGASPLRARFPIIRIGSHSSRPTTPVSSRPTTPISSRPTTPSSPNTRRYPSEPRKSSSMRFQAEKDGSKDTEQTPTKSKRLLMALLSRRKSRKDDSLYTFLDEY